MTDATHITATPEIRRHIHLVIDRSGSMADKKSDTEGGIRTLLAEQAEIAIPTTVSLVDFDTEVRFVYELENVNDAPAYTLVPRGMTALLDAVGESVANLKRLIKAMPKQDRPTQVVFVIMTDGLENSSREWDLDAVRTLIEKRRAKGWEVLFLGAGIDAFAAARGMGIDGSTTMSYTGDAKGTAAAFSATSRVISEGTESGRYAYSGDDRTAAGGSK